MLGDELPAIPHPYAGEGGWNTFSGAILTTGGARKHIGPIPQVESPVRRRPITRLLDSVNDQPDLREAINRVTLEEVVRLAGQLRLEVNLLFSELQWAIGEERINRVTPASNLFREWSRQPDGLMRFWRHANSTLGAQLTQDEVADIWSCVELTLDSKTRKPMAFQEYLMVAVRSDQKCEICGRRPPEVSLEIDHVVPVARGGDNAYYNLRFLCEYHNRSRGARFRWADVWRRA